MDLSALLAREGIKADDVDALLKWARQRSSALIARIEPGSPIAEALGASFERVRDSNGTPVARTPSRSAPRSIARGVSRPYLGAAVEAALSGKQEEVDLAVETAAAEAEAAAEMAERAAAEAQMAASAFEPAVDLDVDLPVLEDSPPAAAEPDAIPDENDPYIGGFNRFAFNFRRREAEVRSRVTQQEDEARRQTLSRGRERGFERGFEDENRPKTGWDHDFNHDFLPDPPGFEADARLRARRSVEPEPSGLLVLGIPDDEGRDIPVRRVRPPSTGTNTGTGAGTGTGTGGAPPRAADSGPSESFSAELAALEETSGTFPVAADSGPFPVAPAASDSGPQPVARAASGPQSGPQAVARPVSGPQQYDSGPRAAAHPTSGPQAVAHASSGPQVVTRAPSGPQAPGHRGPPPPPPPRSGSAPNPSAKRIPPPPPARDGKDRTRTKTTTASPVPPVTPVTKRGKSKPVKKKVVELGQPVARPISAPVAMASPRQPAPSERSGHRPIPADDEVLVPAAPGRNNTAIPDNLLDDDE
jgi:hypothetical protein